MNGSAIVPAEAPDVSDETLLVRMRECDLEALGELYGRYHRQAFALAFRMLASREAAEEVTQDAFLSVWRQSATFDGRIGRVRPWLFSVVHHRAIDTMRRTPERHATTSLDEAWMRASNVDVFRDAYRGVQRDEIRAALALLPNEQCRVIDLAYFAGCSFIEIAEMTEVPLGTVKSRARLALAKLRGVLDAELAS